MPCRSLLNVSSPRNGPVLIFKGERSIFLIGAARSGLSEPPFLMDASRTYESALASAVSTEKQAKRFIHKPFLLRIHALSHKNINEWRCSSQDYSEKTSKTLVISARQNGHVSRASAHGLHTAWCLQGISTQSTLLSRQILQIEPSPSVSSVVFVGTAAGWD